MTFVRSRRLSMLLAAGLGVALAAGLAAQPVHAAPASPSARIAAGDLGEFTIETPKIYMGLKVNAVARVSYEGIPANVSEVSIDWGDFSDPDPITGESGTVEHEYDFWAKREVTVTAVDETGASTTEVIGTINVVLDDSNPKAKLTKPKKKNRVSSWKTLKGTASDKGSGVACVFTAVFQKRGSKWYYYNGKTWKKGSPKNEKTLQKAYRCVKPSKGKWSWKLNGLKKGTLQIAYHATDKVGNQPVFADVVTAKLTRS